MQQRQRMQKEKKGRGKGWEALFQGKYSRQVECAALSLSLSLFFSYNPFVVIDLFTWKKPLSLFSLSPLSSWRCEELKKSYQDGRRDLPTTTWMLPRKLGIAPNDRRPRRCPPLSPLFLLSSPPPLSPPHEATPHTHTYPGSERRWATTTNPIFIGPTSHAPIHFSLSHSHAKGEPLPAATFLQWLWSSFFFSYYLILTPSLSYSAMLLCRFLWELRPRTRSYFFFSGRETKRETNGRSS